jgi:putative SOS response-associated peptidase YedK
MCGRFTLDPTAAFYDRFQIENRLEDLRPRYNIAPGQMVPVIIAQSPNRVMLMRWGLIPHWAKDEKSSFKMINARVESLTQRAAYRGLLAANRCLVPANGFYEWKSAERAKLPYYIHPRSGSYVAFAGLYDVWSRADGQPLYSFTIITKPAEGVVASLHDRMPVMVAREVEDEWLDPQRRHPQQVLSLLAQRPETELVAYPVSRQVHKPGIDGKELIRPVE